MILKRFKAVLQHDQGQQPITLVASCEDSAIKQLMTAEGCPISAITDIQEIEF